MEERRWWTPLLQDWQERATAILTGLFLLQFVLWIEKEDGVWLTETVVIVKWTLALTIIVELFPRLHRALRCLIQAVALLVVTGNVLNASPVVGDVHPMRQLGAFARDIAAIVADTFTQLEPFVWFASGTWLVALLACWWMKAKGRIMFLLVGSVIALSIRDSFSLLVLWKQVAIVIFCGLFLLVVRHFAGLKHRNPTGWAHLAEYPSYVALPVVLLISLVVFIGTLAPNVRALLTDPYTLWMNMRGKTVDIVNKGTGAATVLGSDPTSGYSRNDSSLGGEFAFDYTPVMTVSTTHRSYWRGETRSLYTGKGWIVSDVERRTPLSPVTADASLPTDPRLAPSKLKTVEVTQTVTLAGEAEYDFPVLFGAYAIDRVQSVVSGGENASLAPLLWSARLSELRWSGRESYPQSYTVVSKVPIVDETELRKVPADLPTTVGLEEYLLLPDSLPARVRELAAKVTQSATNMYDKAKLLEQYLATTYPYTNTPDLSKGRSRDFVDRFLFEIQEGYCDYFSTAMAVMARSIGLPARWVKGYTPGANALDEGVLTPGLEPEQLIDPNGAGDYTVRNADAHSWVEIYFPGYGWIPFEPTAGFALPTFAPEEEAAAPLPESTEAPTEPVEQQEGATMPRAVGWGAGAVVLAIALALVWAGRRSIPLLRSVGPLGKQLDANQRAIVEFERLVRYARRKGYSRAEHETVREMTERWVSKDKWLKKDMESLVELFEKAKYSGERISDEELSLFSRTVHKLKENM